VSSTNKIIVRVYNTNLRVLHLNFASLHLFYDLIMFQRTKQLSNLEEEQLGQVWKTYLTDGYRRICSMV